MPIYEYECQKCKSHTEILQKITDKPLTRCRKCGGKLEKLWSPTSFQFKGSGWYVTDYAGKKSDAGEEKKSSSTEATASDKPKAAETAKKDTPKTTSTSESSSGD